MNNNSNFFKKPFKKGDLFVYSGLSLLFLVAIIISLLIPTNSTNLAYGDINGSHVFIYDFNTNDLNILDSSKITISSQNQESVEITVAFGNEYNKVLINKTDKTISITEATCTNKSCTLMGPIKDGKGIILCSPHNFKIYFANSDSIFMG